MVHVTTCSGEGLLHQSFSHSEIHLFKHQLEAEWNSTSDFVEQSDRDVSFVEVIVSN